MKKEALKRLENIDSMMAQALEMQRLYGPLAGYLIPIRYKKMANIEDFSKIELDKALFPEQFAAKIDRCAGFEIKWVEGV